MEENQSEENIFLERIKELHQSAFDDKENQMVSEVSLILMHSCSMGEFRYMGYGRRMMEI